MKNVEFENKEIRGIYQSIIKENRALAKIILLLKDGKGIKIKDIISSDFETKLLISKNKKNYTLDIDFLQKKIYLGEPNKSYRIIFENVPGRENSPTGHLYQNNDRKIVEKFIMQLNKDTEETRHLELTEKGNHYTILFKGRNKNFDGDDFIEMLLGAPEFNTIRDIFITLVRSINLNSVNIKICDSMGSTIVIEDGLITNYIEYQEKDNEYEKIYLENGNFFVEKKVKESYQDKVTDYVKRMGEYHGKEKRKN